MFPSVERSQYNTIGRLLSAFILRTSPQKHKEVKEVLRIAKAGWNMAAAGSPDAESTKCLLEVRPHIASTPGIEGSMADRALVQMSNLIRHLYLSWQCEGEDLAVQCETVAGSLAEHVASPNKSTQLSMRQHNVLVIWKRIYPGGLVMFCQDVCEGCNCISK